MLRPPDADPSTASVSIRSAKKEEVAGQWEIQPKPPEATWDGTKVIEVWPEGKPIENGRNTRIYSKDEPFPRDLIEKISTGQSRQWKLVEVPVALYQYNPVQKKLYRLIELELSVEYSTRSAECLSTLNFSDPIAERHVKRLAINFDSIAPSYEKMMKAEAEPSGEGGYVIITTSNIVSQSSQLLNFVASKEDQGFTVQVITEGTWGGGTGDAASENIRNWLIANAASLNIEYVLLIGNPNPASGDVPMKMLWPRRGATEYEEAPSDYYYADLTGNWDLDGDGYFGEWGEDFGSGGVDRNWDVLVGRIPFYANLSHLDSILAKLVAYREESSWSGAWRKRVLLPMKPSDSKTPGCHLGEAIKNDVIVPKTGWEYHRIYDEEYGFTPAPETVPCTTANVTNAWNTSPFGAILWWTHGSSTTASHVMDLSHAASLNDDYPGFTFQCSCSNSYPENSSNLSYSSNSRRREKSQFTHWQKCAKVTFMVRGAARLSAGDTLREPQFGQEPLPVAEKRQSIPTPHFRRL